MESNSMWPLPSMCFRIVECSRSSFLFMTGYGYATFCLFIHPLVDIWGHLSFPPLLQNQDFYIAQIVLELNLKLRVYFSKG